MDWIFMYLAGVLVASLTALLLGPPEGWQSPNLSIPLFVTALWPIGLAWYLFFGRPYRFRQLKGEA